MRSPQETAGPRNEKARRGFGHLDRKAAGRPRCGAPVRRAPSDHCRRPRDAQAGRGALVLVQLAQHLELHELPVALQRRGRHVAHLRGREGPRHERRHGQRLRHEQELAPEVRKVLGPQARLSRFPPALAGPRAGAHRGLHDGLLHDGDNQKGLERDELVRGAPAVQRALGGAVEHKQAPECQERRCLVRAAEGHGQPGGVEVGADHLGPEGHDGEHGRGHDELLHRP
mmetsp:Transcript_11511/g.39318  ORF Transcript_11511/g.39318 Transcript_11511/m.39318 type:complete len:228 (-) Transcript_11511:658-1341(-)